MSLADDLGAPPLARRVADIIRRHAAALEAGSDWALMAALRVLVEVDLAQSRPLPASDSGVKDPLTPVAECDCYPHGFTPDTYEGPQEWCPIHGRSAP